MFLQKYKIYFERANGFGESSNYTLDILNVLLLMSISLLSIFLRLSGITCFKIQHIIILYER